MCSPQSKRDSTQNKCEQPIPNRHQCFLNANVSSSSIPIKNLARQDRCWSSVSTANECTPDQPKDRLEPSKIGFLSRPNFYKMITSRTEEAKVELVGTSLRFGRGRFSLRRCGMGYRSESRLCHLSLSGRTRSVDKQRNCSPHSTTLHKS